ncbi:hypothetical protein HYH03_014468 [Edaphochlamys debaryana]|uniref:SWIM-type domain-containing protein n=1 Tax=Edaphochlamys debaryana TaxID=47281 RepID=A0A835XW32_9CHLO|nr:hypothetical protein HYH03_014468 [Edaphochlamys debaryana]|eukprot:KAG2486874.1 hypothetical protein HYH03_014468 [Edaphochlamys debaryana]
MRSDAAHCLDGPFVMYVVTAKRRAAETELLGQHAPAIFASSAWSRVFEWYMGLPTLAWPPAVTRQALRPGSVEWYSTYLAYGRRAYRFHPTEDVVLLPDATLEVSELGGRTWRVSKQPVQVLRLHDQLTGNQLASRLTCSCAIFRVAGRCVHVEYVSRTDLGAPGPAPPVLIPIAPQRPAPGVPAPGDFVWLEEGVFVRFQPQSGALACGRSSCPAGCAHVQAVPECVDELMGGVCRR